MKALTLIEPWATLVVHGHKKIETRSWPTKLRGTIAIHSAKKFPESIKLLTFNPPFIGALIQCGFCTPGDFKLGYILGTVDIVDCLTTDYLVQPRLFENLSEKERAFGDYSPGRYGWLLMNPVVFKNPIPAKGALGLWDWKEGEVYHE